MKGDQLSIHEIVVPLGFILTVVCMLVPLPVFVIDILQVSNLLFALLLVLGALHIRDPLKVAALPSLLLIATLFRLSLNLATTRAVLGTGHAGKAVEAFGSVVIQGSLVVGFVLFILITLIQFIVVAKGAERVAEVSARFTLDAMPGKQMAIDAEIRSGLLDPEAARRKRNDIQSESRFYGALDGAMKFVKGDAIAGLIITAVNIGGGILVGLLIHGLEIDVALHRYTLLTIGDGLLSQIPSLLNSVAAGLVVTRVQIDELSTLSSDLLSQLGQFTVARAFVGCAACVLGCLPGMPHVALFVVSGMIGTSLLLKRSSSEQPVLALSSPFEPGLCGALEAQIADSSAPFFPPIERVLEGLERCREYAFSRWGLVLQRPALSVWYEASEGSRILIRGIEVEQKTGLCDVEPWADLEARIRQTIDQYRVELIDDGLTRRILDYVEQQIPELVTSVIPGLLSLTQLTSVLRNLLREGITLRHIDVVLQSIAEHGGRLNERQLLAEVRIALAAVISMSVAKERLISGVVLGPLLDLTLAHAEDKQGLVSREIVDMIYQRVSSTTSLGAVLVCSKSSRAYLRDILWIRGARVSVLAHEEISNPYQLRIVEEIEVEGESERAALLEELSL